MIQKQGVHLEFFVIGSKCKPSPYTLQISQIGVSMWFLFGPNFLPLTTLSSSRFVMGSNEVSSLMSFTDFKLFDVIVQLHNIVWSCICVIFSFSGWHLDNQCLCGQPLCKTFKHFSRIWFFLGGGLPWNFGANRMTLYLMISNGPLRKHISHSGCPTWLR
jgi:hypothetical protein